MSYVEKDGLVTLEMSRDDYQMVLLALGYATGMVEGRGRLRWLDLVNRLNEGNPNFRPYETKEQAS